MNLKRAGKTLLFYIVFYIGLFGFSVAMFAVFYQTLDDNQPKLQGDSGLIGNNPGIGFRPMPPDTNGTLIWHKKNEEQNVKYWVENLDEFLQPYHDQIMHKNIYDCENEDKPVDNKFCKFDFKQGFGPCIKNFDYGFGHKLGGGPCIFLKLNKIYGWQPEYYTSETTPYSMPEHLRLASS